jgi:hypothetical protein
MTSLAKPGQNLNVAVITNRWLKDFRKLPIREYRM